MDETIVFLLFPKSNSFAECETDIKKTYWKIV